VIKNHIGILPNGNYVGWFDDIPFVKEESKDIGTLMRKLLCIREKYDYDSFELSLEQLCEKLEIYIHIDYD